MKRVQGQLSVEIDVKVGNHNPSQDVEDRYGEDDDYQNIESKKKVYGFPCCCRNWKSDTWWGLGAIFSGMMLQASLGIASIWGNIVIYEASMLRGHDP